MATLRDLVGEHTSLAADRIAHLHRLVGDWQLLADLSFADLLLWVRVRDDLVDDLAGHLPHRGAGGVFLCVAQMRPTTGPTSYLNDRVGAVVGAQDRFLLGRAWLERRICREGEPDWDSGVPVRQETVPVCVQGDVVAVLSRDTNLAAARVPSQLELAYLSSAADLVQMVVEGTFPAVGSPTAVMAAAPRVGDGFLRLDPDGRVDYASPNALSAFRRLGATVDLAGAELAAVWAAAGGVPLQPQVAHQTEVEAYGAVVQLRVIPLRFAGRPAGTVVLAHDVTELRSRDRALLTKDATIREIHHRVKNNLQTVAALLRLQARRLDVPEARHALAESVRRVSAIALVHETLALTLDESVDFDGIADRVIDMVAEIASPAADVTTRRRGSFGVLPAPVATALSTVLTELLQNAVEHAFPAGSPGGTVEVVAARDGERLEVRVIDDGAGLPAGFQMEESTRLGLQIVRTLVAGELGGTLMLVDRPGGGTQAVLALSPPGV